MTGVLRWFLIPPPLMDGSRQSNRRPARHARFTTVLTSLLEHLPTQKIDGLSRDD
jgi:hypothetical protein